MDWTACVICQNITTEALRCPLNAPGSGDKSEPYRTFLNNVSAFRKLERLPVSLPFGDSISVDDFINHEAHWHKSCYGKFTRNKVERAERKREIDDAVTANTAVDEKRSRGRQSLSMTACIFCTSEGGHLHEFRTLDADENVRRMATDLQDTTLLSRIAGGDLIALGAKYHINCLTVLRNRHRSLIRQSHESSDTREDEMKIKARAFIELTASIENSVEDGIFHFKFAELRQLYESRLHDLGIEKEINKARFKEQVLEYFPTAQEQSDGKNVVLVFEQGMHQMVKQSLKCDYEGDAMILAKAAKIVREDIFNTDGFQFDASFSHQCQQNSVPPSLTTLVSMLLNGADIRQQDSRDSQKCLTISQTILFNCTKKTPTATKSRHSANKEPPLPLYIGLKVHTQTRSKNLITLLYDLGLSVSYDRILVLENQLATAVCQHIQKEGIVCPSQLRHGLFTVGALDNLDHNPSSTTAKGSFHGTAISLFQSRTSSNMGQCRETISLPSANTQKLHSLPDSFTTVPAVALKEATVEVPMTRNEVNNSVEQIHVEVKAENQWLFNALSFLKKDIVVQGDAVTWSAYHASRQDDSNVDDKQKALSQLLPLFYEKAATAAMVKHGMNVSQQATQFLNPGQIPVIAMDAPLYALGKYIQWNWPQTHGEENYVIMFGGLHIEMSMWSTFGDYLENSGWTTALTQAGIASAGTADSFLRCSHLTRTRQAHQITALALAKLQDDAFASTSHPQTDEVKEIWKIEMIGKSPTFQYWNTILNIELMGLVFIRAHREANFSLYVDTLKALCPWFFALDHQNYARWIPVHIRDMENLPSSIKDEFAAKGHWVVCKTTNRFSAMPIDQAHEQNNEMVKGSGGVIGLTQNPSAFRKWMLAGPEQARLLQEFEESFAEETKNHFHHEEGLSIQKHFRQQALNLAETMSEMGNPFLNDTPELLTLDNSNVMNESVVDTVRTIEAVGKNQYDDYCKSVLIDCTRSIHRPKKKKVPTATLR